MQSLIALLIAVQGLVPELSAYAGNCDQLPEVVVTAPRSIPQEQEPIMMDEVVVTAPRYRPGIDECVIEVVYQEKRKEKPVSPREARVSRNNEAARVLDEVVVTAPRYRPHIDDDVMKAATHEYQNIPAASYLHRAPRLNTRAARVVGDINVVQAAMTISGDYEVPANDTIDEDVTITGGNATIDGVIDGDLAVMGGAVDVNGMVDGDVAVFGGNLDILGKITGDAAIIGGNIQHGGVIEGDLAVVGGTARLDSGSVVEGNIEMVGGSVDRDTLAQVLGEIKAVEIKGLHQILPRIGSIFRFPSMVPAADVFPRLVLLGILIVTYLLNLFILLIFSGVSDRIAAKFKKSVWASLGFGLGMQVLFVPLLVLFVLSIIGIPLALLLPFAIAIAVLFGYSALSLVVGERVISGLNWKVQGRPGIFTIGWLALMIIPIVTILIGPPLFALGLVTWYVSMTIGLGGTIYALIKRKDSAGT